MAYLNLIDIGCQLSEAKDIGEYNEYSIMNSYSRNIKLSLQVKKDLDWDMDFWDVVNDKISVLLYHEIGLDRDWRFVNREQAIKFIGGLMPRMSPNDKLLNLLEYLHSLANFEGQMVEVDRNAPHQKNIWMKLFFNSAEEFRYYVDCLKSKGWIEIIEQSPFFLTVQLTFNGLQEVGNYLESKNSNICFVAMSFDDSLKPIYTAGIEPAIIETGFVPLIMHGEHIEAALTINDAMVASIKKAKFTIADFTQHKDGVYFEAGFALGRGQKVIFTCKEDEIDNAHFDTRNYQHITWKDAADLKQKLIAKIEAYIKD